MRAAFRASLQTVADLVYPPHCVVCEERQLDRWICAACDAAALRLEGPACPVCSRPFVGAMDAFLCPNCRGETLALHCAVAVMQARGSVRELIHRFKYGGEQTLRRVLGDWLAAALDDARLSGFATASLVPVPLHAARFRERRFNQAEALASWVAQRRGRRVADLLRRRRHTQTQTQFDRRQRMRNLRGAFALRHNAAVKDQSFLLVDDVLTTGSTLDACARVLLEAGARSVAAITVARG